MVKFLHPIYKRMKSVGASPEHRAFLEAIDNQLNDLEADVAAMVSEMKIKEATGGWLDAWGDWYGVERPSKMTSDDEYREYILREVTKPKNTIPGIVEEIERHLPEGSSVRVHEPYVDIFRFNISQMNMTDRIQDDKYTRHAVIDIIIDGPLPPHLNDIVKEVKAAGIKVYFTRDSSIWDEDEDGNLIHVRMYSLVEPSIGILTHTQLEVKPMDVFYLNNSPLNDPDYPLGGRAKLITNISKTSELYTIAKRQLTTSRNTSFENIENVSMDEEWLDDYFDATSITQTLELYADNPDAIIKEQTVDTSTASNLINMHTPFILGNSAIPVERYFDTPVWKLYDHGERGEAGVYAGTPTMDGLMLWYDFSLKDNYSPGRERVTDLSGNGNHGILKNFSYTKNSGYGNKGLRFDNADDHVLTNVNLADFTILTTVYLNENDSVMLWGGSPTAYYLRRLFGDKLHASTATSERQETKGVDNIFNRGESALANVGMSVEVSTNRLTVIFNGEIVSESKLTGVPLPFKLTHIGTWYTLSDPSLEGLMYSFQVYNRALTPLEIKHNYAIEKEKFLDNPTLPPSSKPVGKPIGEASIAETFKVGRDK